MLIRTERKDMLVEVTQLYATLSWGSGFKGFKRYDLVGTDFNGKEVILKYNLLSIDEAKTILDKIYSQYQSSPNPANLVYTMPTDEELKQMMILEDK